MRIPFETVDTQSSAGTPAASQAILDEIQAARGMTTNLERAMAFAPALLAAYTQVMALFAQTSLTALEQQIVLQTISADNDCRYCVAWHTAMLQRMGLSAEESSALRHGKPLTDLRLEALRRFSLAILIRRGHLDSSEIHDFLSHGWTTQQALEVIVGISAKTLSNYASSLTGVEIDKAVEKFFIPAG